MELRQIEVFLAVADELHFGRAAARLHLAQPSVSQQLKRLEREVGVLLVRRDSHRVELTPAGEAFRERVRIVRAEVAQATAAARSAAAGRMGTVRLGFNFPSGRLVVPPLLARLAQAYPDLATSLWEAGTSEQLQALSSGDLDVGFIAGAANRPCLASRSVARVPMVALVGEGHRLARRSSVGFADLADEACVIGHRESSPATHDCVINAAKESGHPLRVVDHVDDVGGTLVLVSTGAAVSFATAIRGRQAATSGAVALRLAEPTPHVELHVAWQERPGNPLVDNPLARNVLELIP